MVRDLCRDETILSTPCDPATEVDGEVAQDLLDTLEATEDALCLAANQIGVTKQIAVVLGDNNEPIVIMNPSISRALYPTKMEEECLTLDYPVTVKRFGKITINYDQIVNGKLVPRKREFMGGTAQAVQHAIDHCKGKLV